MHHVVFLINSIPTPLLHNITSYENIFGKPCDISFFKVFGCLCYASTITTHRKNLDDRSVRGVFLGFPHNTKGYIFLSLKYHSIEISRHVIFHENCFPYKLNCGLNRGPNTSSLPPLTESPVSAPTSNTAPLTEPHVPTATPSTPPDLSR